MTINDIVFGTYSTVITTEQMEFFSAMSGGKLPSEEVKKFAGSRMTLQIKKYGDKIGTKISYDKLPELNTFTLTQEGVEHHIHYPHPFGTSSGSYHTVPGSDGKKIIARHTNDSFGMMETDETFDEDGITIITRCNGKSFTSYYEREVNQKGSFRYVAGKNAGDGLFPFFGKFDLTNYVVRLDVGEDRFRSTETIGDGKEMTLEGKFNEEVHFEGYTMVVTKVGKAKTKMVVKDTKSKVVTEWTSTFTDDFLTSTFVNHCNGKSGEIIMERFSDISGTYKPITKVGTKEFVKAICKDPKTLEKLNDLVADPSERFTVKEMAGSFFEISYHNAFVDMKLNFKLGEETEYPSPMAPGSRAKMVATKQDNVLVVASKLDEFEGTTHLTVTENFLIKEAWLGGSSFKETVIMAKC